MTAAPSDASAVRREDVTLYRAVGVRQHEDLPFNWYVVGPDGEVAYCQMGKAEEHAAMIVAALNDRVEAVLALSTPPQPQSAEAVERSYTSPMSAVQRKHRSRKDAIAAAVAADRSRGQMEGRAAVVQWLRGKSATNPPPALRHAAAMLADQFESERVPSAAIRAGEPS